MSAELLYDLLAACTELERRAPFKELANSIRRRYALLSTARDIEIARAHLDLAGELGGRVEPIASDGEYQSQRDAYTVGALIFRAVMTYTSATHSLSIGNKRWKVHGLKKLPSDVSAAHDRLCTLRDKALAHFGDGARSVPTAWALDAYVFKIDDDGASVDLWWIRSNYLQTVADDAHRCITYYDDALRIMVKEGKMEFDTQMALAAADPEFLGAISKYRFSREAFFGIRDLPVNDFAQTLLTPAIRFPEAARRRS